MTSVQTCHPTPIPAASSSTEANTPTTPRMHPIQPSPQHRDDDMSTTPTSSSFAEANGKRALPKSPPAPAHLIIGGRNSSWDEHRRPLSQRSNKSGDSQDVDMKIEDDDEEESDGEMEDSVDGETGRPTKKKKGQRFFCTEFPPCNLSFTRSEHLARHIRKHTGERPFQCHCNRRFSRLDNLRQHAQTVHVNEKIPGDSLAATGTRFQRQIRTDRVRPAGARSRASTTSSQTSHGRGHARNLSTSSIASTASNVSTISSMSQDPRQYPQPLMMAPEHRHSGGLTIDTMRASPGFTYSQHSSGGPSTPTSTHYSQGPASPFGSTMGSPISASRFSASHFENRGGRRLSVPNGASPFQNGPGPQFVTPMSPSSAFASGNTSSLNSPTSSVFSNRLDTSHGEPELKRRTWHPSTYNSGWHQRPATSGLSYSQTPDAPRPAFSGQPPPAASQPVRLPGFGDLMQTIHRPATPPGQIAQPVTESPSRPPLMSAGGSSDRSVFNERPGHRSLDMSIYQNLNKLDIASGTPPRENASWGQQVPSDPNHALPTTQTPPTHPQFVQIQAQPIAPGHQPLAPAPAPPAAHAAPQGMANAPSQPQSLGTEPDQHATAGTRNRRQGWYKGPIAPAPQVITTAQQHRVSPASSSSEGVPTPSDPSFQHHPTIVHTNSFGDASSGHPSASSATAYPHAYASTSTTGQGAEGIPNESVADYSSKPLTGLDALVAAATSESRAREAAVQR